MTGGGSPKSFSDTSSPVNSGALEPPRGSGVAVHALKSPGHFSLGPSYKRRVKSEGLGDSPSTEGLKEDEEELH